MERQDVLYIGYGDSDPFAAEKKYTERIGIAPTVIIARPEFELLRTHPLVVRSVHGIANGLLVTHMIKPRDVMEMDGRRSNDPRMPLNPTDVAEREVDSNGQTQLAVTNLADRLGSQDEVESVPKRGRGRPSFGKGICPHCGGTITETGFEKLGYWYGWVYGIEPPYWQVLRRYVFNRDDYTCQKCGRKLPIRELQCHHLTRKEDGGTDNAKNLTTLCSKCHQKYHDEEEIDNEIADA